MRTTHNWLNATVISITDITPTVREFELLPEDVAALAFAPGAHLQVRLPLTDGEPQTRSYSLIGLPNGSCYRIAVKRMDAGRGGSLHMWQLTRGDRLVISEPQSHFPLSFDAPSYLLIAGGIGITPLVAMAEALNVHRTNHAISVRMVYGARRSDEADEFAYADRLREALGTGLQLLNADAGERIDFAAEIAQLHPDGQVYCCGPVPMLDAIKKAWANASRPAQNLRFETFGNSGHLESQSFTVRVPRHHLEIEVAVSTSLLDALQAAGVAVLHDCRRGECGLCTLDILSVDGELDHRDVFLSEREKQAATRLCACVSRARGTLTLDSAFRDQ